MARSRKQFAGLLALFAAFFLSAAAGWAEIDPSTVQKLLAGDGAEGDYFGRSVSVDSNTAVVGAIGDDDNGENSGSAYVFIRNGDGIWSQQAKLLPNDGASGDRFGTSASISENIIVIGVPDDNDCFGSAYVFVGSENGTWNQKAKLLPNDGVPGDRFGSSVTIDGNTIIIGSMIDSDMSGAAYVFIRNADGSWSQQAKLLPDDGAAGDQFGRWSVSVSGDTAVIDSSESAYVFVRNGDNSWSQQAKIIMPNNGSAVSVSGNTAVIGDAESAYVFVRNGDSSWSQQAKLTPNDGTGDDWFGRTVCVSNNMAIISAPMDNDNGSAYVFVRNEDGSWNQQVKLIPYDEIFGATFGYEAVSLSGDTVIIGAQGDDENGSNSGAAYIYTSASTPSSDVSVTVTGPSGGGTYHPGDQVTINWETENADPADTMVLSMKRDAVSTMPAPDERSWFRFTENTSNDGSEIVTIPDSVVAASDWRFYVGHATSGAYDAVDATFTLAAAPNTHDLYLTKSGEGSGTVTSSPGSLSCGSACANASARFSSGDVVVLTATPSSCSKLVSWEGCDSSGGNTCTVTMDKRRDVVAEFAPENTGTLRVRFDHLTYEAGKIKSNPVGIDVANTENYAE